MLYMYYFFTTNLMNNYHQVAHSIKVNMNRLFLVLFLPHFGNRPYLHFL